MSKEDNIEVICTFYGQRYPWEVPEKIIPKPTYNYGSLLEIWDNTRPSYLIEASEKILKCLSPIDAIGFRQFMEKKLNHWMNHCLDSPLPNEKIGIEEAWRNLWILNYNVVKCLYENYSARFDEAYGVEFIKSMLDTMEHYFLEMHNDPKVYRCVNYKGICEFYDGKRFEPCSMEESKAMAEEKRKKVKALSYEKTLQQVKDCIDKGGNPFTDLKAEISTGADVRPYTKNDGGEIVQKAPHYQNIPLKDRNGNVVELEAWEIITSILEYLNLNPRASWAMGDALKYVLRCGRKFGDEKAKTKGEKAIQDLRKVAYYVNKAADWYEDVGDTNEESTINNK